MCPRVSWVTSHQVQDPMFIVAKLIMEKLYLQGGRGSARQGKVLDPRGMFIVMTGERAWLWAGNKIFAGNKTAYRNAAFSHFKLL